MFINVVVEANCDCLISTVLGISILRSVITISRKDFQIIIGTFCVIHIASNSYQITAGLVFTDFILTIRSIEVRNILII